ncbi:MAG: SRPBCC family protein [Halobacteriota archaeon]
MDEISVSTVVYLPPEEVYEFLVDFPRYAEYSEHLTDVYQDGDGSPGTRYALRFAWWKLSYTARSEVTAVDPPRRIDWTIIKDIEADGCWRIEPLSDLPDDAPPDAETASLVWFDVQWHPGSARESAVDLPRLVSLDWVIERVRPLVEREAERIVERIVADLEGRKRPVHLEVRKGSAAR